MEGKRYRHAIFPSFNIGGLIQFEDGYWPPIGQPPCIDSGYCSYVEKNPTFGHLIFECGDGREQAQEELREDHSDLLARAEMTLARMMRAQNMPDTVGAPLPPDASAAEDRLPTPGEIKRLNRAELLVLGERLGIADEKYKNSSRSLMITAVIGELAAIEE